MTKSKDVNLFEKSYLAFTQTPHYTVLYTLAYTLIFQFS
jgi:hypothetical protein